MSPQLVQSIEERRPPCKPAMVVVRIKVAFDGIAYRPRIVILRRKHIRNVSA
jgi:hypothetical protein